MHCTGVIMAGGGALRFAGEPKGLSVVGGERIVDRVAAALRASADDLLLVANDAAAITWLPGVRVERDVRPGEGSLGGVLTALTHSPGAVLVVAWDMPFVSAALLHRLRSLGEQGGDAVWPESRSRYGAEPLCAWYAPSALPAIVQALEEGDRRIVSLRDRMRVLTLDLATVATFGDPDRLFLNVNRREDLPLAQRLADGAGE